jgi:hypothetical protein
MAIIFKEFMPLARTNGDMEWAPTMQSKILLYDTRNARVTCARDANAVRDCAFFPQTRHDKFTAAMHARGVAII